ncbi:MAG: hypothetical protein HRT35_23505 [Algicola sp.]|nr:hypothetical protein [Algicola sp.]
MNIFVTVGTTAFDALFEQCDRLAQRPDWQLTGQIADGNYHPKNFQSVRFTDDIGALCVAADLIITHAGAGTVFELLESHKKLILVPNTTRKDPHQIEMANYVTANRYGLVCDDLSQLEALILSSENFTPQPYSKTDFFKTEEIINQINALYR